MSNTSICQNCLKPIPVLGVKYVGGSCSCGNQKAFTFPKHGFTHYF